jgi:hypothetical protein
MTPKLQIFIGIMAFYALLAYVVFPVGFYYLIEKTLASAGNGFIVGSVVSVILWLFVGKNLIE